MSAGTSSCRGKGHLAPARCRQRLFSFPHPNCCSRRLSVINAAGISPGIVSTGSNTKIPNK